MKIGSSVQFRVNGMGKTVFKATLISIGQKVDEDTRSVEVYARVDTVNSQFRAGHVCDGKDYEINELTYIFAV